MNADGRRIASSRVVDGVGGVVSGGSVVESCGVDGGVDVVESGSEALVDVRAEKYCRRVVDGVEPLEAWCLSFCDDEGISRYNRSKCCSYRSRLGKRLEVIARIKWLASNGSGASSISRFEKRSMLDSLLKKTYEKAMDAHASAKDVSACLEVLARHDIVHGDVEKPRVEVMFPQLERILGAAAIEAVESRLGIKKCQGAVVDAKLLSVKECV